MKKFVAYISLVILMTNTTFGQKEEYFVSFDNDTVYVDFKVMSKIVFYDLTWQMKYYDSLHKVCKLSPKHAREVYFYLNEKPYHFISILNTPKLPSPPNLSGLRFFAELKVDGPLKLVTYYGIRLMLPSIQADVKNIMIKPDNEMLFLDQFGIKKKIMRFLSDCPELVQKLKEKDKELKWDDQICRYYNLHCGNE
ncbi:MAG TPA: hypothetical protein VFC92_01360 [Bacteroidales bacterium]|nr:hypothetical protein [Bacteroidales bacterium]